MDYEAVIGLEVHLHLKTKTKAFCGCSTEFGQAPNSQTCPVCLGLPGALPALNRTALDFAVKTALALNCRIQEQTKFDRKNYFYPDLPKNYQISQYDLPLSVDGFLEIELDDKIKRVRIRRVHLEEDAGKLIHRQDVSLVDLNRAGIPLLEIVSEPDINSGQEAQEYLKALKNTIEYLDVSDCDMEKGSLRCDANISIRARGVAELGVKTELKNMNSFKAVKDALNFEIERQKESLDKGEAIIQETRLWDVKEAKTISMRTKEGEQDYRYFPEPDLPVFNIDIGKVKEIKDAIPELPRQKMQRFMKDYGLSGYDAKILVSSKKDASYVQQCIEAYPDKDKKPVVNLLIGPLAAEANSRNCGLADLKVPAKDLADLAGARARDEISNLSANTVLAQMIDTRKSAAQIIAAGGFRQISDTDSLGQYIDEVIKENPKSAGDYRQGKSNALMFLVGQVMKKTKGKANPKTVNEMLKRRMEDA